jgi:hypothetical protein
MSWGWVTGHTVEDIQGSVLLKLQSVWLVDSNSEVIMTPWNVNRWICRHVKVLPIA